MKYAYLIKFQDYVWGDCYDMCIAMTLKNAENWICTYAKNNHSIVEKIADGLYTISGVENFDVKVIKTSLA